MTRIRFFYIQALLITSALIFSKSTYSQPIERNPNVILIYADDLGYGDLSCYGATKINTPNLDKLAQEGTTFTNAHSSSSTCTPSRYALMTGNYPWRTKGTNILPGDAKLILSTDQLTLPKLFKNAGYKTAIAGKWHLGLGTTVEKNWNERISPGPNDIGFDYSFIFPATADRVPTIFVENQYVVGLDPNNPINVNYKTKIGTEPTGKENPELLKMKSSLNQGHDNTIINGIGRIGYMEGGTKARWVDEEVSTTFLQVAQDFITTNKDNPFFLFFSMTEPHVPRMPATIFKGKSELGYRGDAILQLDWTVGQIMQQLDLLGLRENTLIIFTSDNGPVLDDGYDDDAVSKNGTHRPTGPLRGGKYSVYEAGTRVPFIVAGAGTSKNVSSNALFSQVDFLACFAQMLNQQLPKEVMDSQPLLSTLQGKDKIGRSFNIQHGRTLAIVKDHWKYIEPNDGPPISILTNIELGNSPKPQLYNLAEDIGETANLATQYPEKLKELQSLLLKEKNR